MRGSLPWAQLVEGVAQARFRGESEQTLRLIGGEHLTEAQETAVYQRVRELRAQAEADRSKQPAPTPREVSMPPKDLSERWGWAQREGYQPHEVGLYKDARTGEIKEANPSAQIRKHIA